MNWQSSVADITGRSDVYRINAESLANVRPQAPGRNLDAQHPTDAQELGERLQEIVQAHQQAHQQELGGLREELEARPRSTSERPQKRRRASPRVLIEKPGRRGQSLRVRVRRSGYRGGESCLAERRYRGRKKSQTSVR